MTNATETRLAWVDRAGWPRGAWDAEPDRSSWRDEATGLPCIARRNRMGAWCGYVAVPPGHPWHGVNFSAYPDGVTEYPEAHGGITYSQACNGDEVEGVCHRPAPGEPDDVWWVGFDCAHSGDLDPGSLALDAKTGWVRSAMPWPETYKTLDEVKRWCADLAEQVKAKVR